MITKELLIQKANFSPFYEIEYNQKGRILAIGDIHGCINTFIQLLNKINLKKEDQLFLLGDLVNKGPNSIGVINKVLDLIFEGYEIYPLRGNHESFVIDDLNKLGKLVFHPSTEEDQLKYSRSIYHNFFNILPYYYRIENVIMVHAGLNLKAENPFLDYESMLWLWEFDPIEQLEYKVIHGHTNIFLQFIKDSVQENLQVINLDNGCYKKGSWGKGNLIALDVLSNTLYIQENIEE